MELDVIKKIWKEQKIDTFSSEEILAMLKKKSFSMAKLIFYVSLAEFAFWIFISIVLPDNHHLSKDTMFFLEIISYVNKFIVIAFIVAFFLNYRKIKAEQNTAQLLKSIFKTRKTVQYYIIYNLSMVLLSTGIILVWLFYYETSSTINKIKINGDYSLFVILCIFLAVLFVTLLYFFYRLLYGKLLFRLKKNYEEMKQLE